MWLSRRATHNRVNLVRREVQLIQMATSGSIVATGLRPRIVRSRVAQHGVRFDALGSQPVRLVKETDSPVRLGAGQPKLVGHVGHCQMQQRSADSTPLGDRADEELAQHPVIRNGRQKANGAFAVLCCNDRQPAATPRWMLSRQPCSVTSGEEMPRAMECQLSAQTAATPSRSSFRKSRQRTGNMDFSVFLTLGYAEHRGEALS